MLKFAWMQYVSILVVFYLGFQGICMLIYPSQVCPRVVVGWVKIRFDVHSILYCMYSGADTVIINFCKKMSMLAPTLVDTRHARPTTRYHITPFIPHHRCSVLMWTLTRHSVDLNNIISNEVSYIGVVISNLGTINFKPSIPSLSWGASQ